MQIVAKDQVERAALSEREWSERLSTPGAKIYNREGTEAGEATGGTRFCRLEGCTGRRIYLRWPDKKITYPCSEGIVERADGNFQIG